MSLKHILLPILLAAPIIVLLAYLVPYSLWKYTKEAGLRVGFFTLAHLRVQRLPGRKLMKALKFARDHEVSVTLHELIAHHRAGGDIKRWLEGYVEARDAGWPLTLEKAAEIEKDGLDICKVAEILNDTTVAFEAV